MNEQLRIQAATASIAKELDRIYSNMNNTAYSASTHDCYVEQYNAYLNKMSAMHYVATYSSITGSHVVTRA